MLLTRNFPERGRAGWLASVVNTASQAARCARLGLSRTLPGWMARFKGPASQAARCWRLPRCLLAGRLVSRGHSASQAARCARLGLYTDACQLAGSRQGCARPGGRLAAYTGRSSHSQAGHFDDRLTSSLFIGSAGSKIIASRVESFGGVFERGPMAYTRSPLD